MCWGFAFRGSEVQAIARLSSFVVRLEALANDEEPYFRFHFELRSLFLVNDPQKFGPARGNAGPSERRWWRGEPLAGSPVGLTLIVTLHATPLQKTYSGFTKPSPEF